MALQTGSEKRSFRAQRSPGASVFGVLAWSRLAESLQFTPRELQIIRDLFDSRTESEIAASLGIAARTVHTHLERVHRKLAVQSRAQLLTRIIAEYLLLYPQPGEMEPACSPDAESRSLCPLHDNRLCPLHAAQAVDNVADNGPEPVEKPAR